MKNIFLMLSILLLALSCKDSHEKLTEKEFNIINKCVNYINKFNEKDCYIVDPYFNYFSFSNYSDEINRTIIEKMNKPEADLKKIEKNINKDFFQKYNIDLNNLSTCGESFSIMGFSGIGNDMIIGYFSNNIKKVKNTMLTRDYELHESEINYFIFLLDKEGNIKEVLKDGLIIG